MTLVVATAMGDTPDELYERCRAAAKVADWVEVRLDGPSGLPWDLRPYFTLDRPALATVRHADDGGRSHADDGTRADLLRRALRAGARAIDVELSSSQARALIAEAHELTARVVVSVHDLSGTPTAARILDDLREARALGADYAKVATRLEKPDDAAHLVEAAVVARAEGIPFALMAVNDPVLRVLAPSLGMALAYGAVPGAPPATVGQVSAERLRAAHARQAALPGVTGATRAAFLLGHPVAHSKSPTMHNAAFRASAIDAAYVALEVLPDDLPAALGGLRALRPLGVNVTVPHKVESMRLVDALHPSAEQAGAVNTIEVHAGRLIGHNTDGDGALDALAEARVSVDGARAIVLGAGGAARAVVAALAREGASVLVANRTRAKADEVARAFSAQAIDWADVPAMLLRADLLVNATSVGMEQATSPVEVSRLPAKDITVMDCVYRVGGTPLLHAAKARGLRVVPGEAMLLHQGARAFRIWTGVDAPIEAMRAALERGA